MERTSNLSTPHTAGTEHGIFVWKEHQTCQHHTPLVLNMEYLCGKNIKPVNTTHRWYSTWNICVERTSNLSTPHTAGTQHGIFVWKEHQTCQHHTPLVLNMEYLCGKNIKPVNTTHRWYSTWNICVERTSNLSTPHTAGTEHGIFVWKEHQTCQHHTPLVLNMEYLCGKNIKPVNTTHRWYSTWNICVERTSNLSTPHTAGTQHGIFVWKEHQTCQHHTQLVLNMEYLCGKNIKPVNTTHHWYSTWNICVERTSNLSTPHTAGTEHGIFVWKEHQTCQHHTPLVLNMEYLCGNNIKPVNTTHRWY